jgi:hypothetical protein
MLPNRNIVTYKILPNTTTVTRYCRTEILLLKDASEQKYCYLQDTAEQNYCHLQDTADQNRCFLQEAVARTTVTYKML